MKLALLAGTGLVAVLGVGYYAYQASTVTPVAPAQAAVMVAPTTPEPVALAQAFFKAANIPPALQIQETDVILGDPNAPVTVVEYISMTCPHCATFHNDILPRLKAEFVDTGKVNVIVRDLPWDSMALGISMLTRCVEREMYFPLVSAFMRTQNDWLRGENALAEIKKVARLSGVTSEQVDACVEREDLRAQVLQSREVAQTVLNIKGTPTIFVNGERMDGLRGYRDLKEAVEAALKAVAQPT